MTNLVQERYLTQVEGHGDGCVFPLLLTQLPLQTNLTEQDFIC